MKAFNMIGGAVSPNAVVVAESATDARRIYNDWLEITYGRRDNGVGVSEFEPGYVCVYREGLTIYGPGVKGAPDPRFRQEKPKKRGAKPEGRRC